MRLILTQTVKHFGDRISAFGGSGSKLVCFEDDGTTVVCDLTPFITELKGDLKPGELVSAQLRVTALEVRYEVAP